MDWFLLGIISRYRPKNGVKKRSHKTESNSKPMRPKGEKTQRKWRVQTYYFLYVLLMCQFYRNCNSEIAKIITLVRSLPEFRRIIKDQSRKNDFSQPTDQATRARRTFHCEHVRDQMTIRSGINKERVIARF